MTIKIHLITGIFFQEAEAIKQSLMVKDFIKNTTEMKSKIFVASCYMHSIFIYSITRLQ